MSLNQRKMSNSISDRQSVYFLNSSAASPYVLERYHQLVQQAEALGEFLTFDSHASWLSCYSRDAQWLESQLPLLVFRPHTCQSIPAFIELCAKAAIPVTVRCGGTGLRGAAVAAQEGIILLTGHLKKLIIREDSSFVAEPGVTVRQLNQQVKEKGWEFPLPLATAGVAGLAGCLSTQAISYDQQAPQVWKLIEEVTLVDGVGKIQQVPASLVCGAEGLFGVIMQIKGRFSKRPVTIQRGECSLDWATVEQVLPHLRTLQSLTVLSWEKDVLTYQVEGEPWRVEGTKALMNQWLKHSLSFKELKEREDCLFNGSKQPYFILGSLLAFSHFALFTQQAQAWAQDLDLQCTVRCNLLTNHLLYLLEGKESIYDFKQNLHQFLVLWCNALVTHEGKISHCQGIGLQLPFFTPPFWNEDQVNVLKQLQQRMDPSQLFSKDRFFPLEGKSLEKMRE
jgi:glycolate oxidase